MAASTLPKNDPATVLPVNGKQNELKAAVTPQEEKRKEKKSIQADILPIVTSLTKYKVQVIDNHVFGQVLDVQDSSRITGAVILFIGANGCNV